jgi:hypothetical protein
MTNFNISGRGWTSRTHGFFASMGGFILSENGAMTEVLSIERLEELESKGSINWPRISEKEIEDRSKGDAFSKGFAVLQATWFITQCVARGIYGLAITELEVATLAFAALNGVLYFLWWNKPRGVACPVPVYLISSKRETGTQTMNLEYEAILDHTFSSISVNTSLATNVAPSDKDVSQNNDPLWKPTPLEPLSFTAFVRYCVKFKGMVLSMFSIGPILNDIALCTTIKAPALSVPLFYSPSCGTPAIVVLHRSAYIGFIIGTLFGGIHCIAWFFRFPSVEEQYVWQTSAAIITAMPIVYAGLFIFEPKPTLMSRFIVKQVRSMMILVYLVSRIALLILPLIALRSLPPGSLLAIRWSSFIIPHSQ